MKSDDQSVQNFLDRVEKHQGILIKIASVYAKGAIENQDLVQDMHDLENQVSEKTPLVRQQRQTLTKWMIFSAIIGLLLFIWGLLRYLHS
ncbi:hypothetical protein JW992_10965 [candidate division KSB1 bacterium]|nr:hypothetical protein [candidate division KSB1 bacterium]